MNQLNFFEKRSKTRKGKRLPGRPRTRPEGCFGGSHFKNYNPRGQRPILSSKALHLVLRSSLAKGRFALNHPQLEAKVWEIIQKHAQKNGLRIYEYANAGNHLHLLIRAKRRDDYCRFIRSVTGLIARAVKGCQRGKPLKGRFWDARPFTRIVGFAGHEFKKVKLYLARNRCEALGFVEYQPRSKARNSKDWKDFWSLYTCVP